MNFAIAAEDIAIVPMNVRSCYRQLDVTTEFSLVGMYAWYDQPTCRKLTISACHYEIRSWSVIDLWSSLEGCYITWELIIVSSMLQLASSTKFVSVVDSSQTYGWQWHIQSGMVLAPRYSTKWWSRLCHPARWTCWGQYSDYHESCTQFGPKVRTISLCRCRLEFWRCSILATNVTSFLSTRVSFIACWTCFITGFFLLGALFRLT